MGEPAPPQPPPPSPSPPSSPVGEEAGENELDLHHVLDHFTRTVTVALQGRRNTEAADIKRAKELGAHELFGTADPTEAENCLTDIEKVFEVLAVVTATTYPIMRALAQAQNRVAKKLSAGSARRHKYASGFGGPSQGPSKRDGSSSSLAGQLRVSILGSSRWPVRLGILLDRLARLVITADI
ncbi:PREDICTED: leiomodin-2 [Prunus dulcis]|uniref:PREDICTED: leiomodin-2 n=1 Tax=Prunus dulcis TaxID=3755 RepID=A0A5E4GIR9_PRUDU|nr:PREDICTED: leiomodin-2 [Prunus dulcis]